MIYSIIKMMASLFNLVITAQNAKTIRDEYPKSFLDKSFQRLGGMTNKSGWKRSNSEKFINKFIRGTVTAIIHKSRVKANIEDLKLIPGTRKEDVEYYSKVEKMGYEDVIIDGNNTQSAIYFTLSTKDQIKQELRPEVERQVGENFAKREDWHEKSEEEKNNLIKEEVNKVLQTYAELKIKVKDPIDNKNKYFEDLNKDLQQKIENIQVLVHSYNSISFKQMCQLFKDINRNTKLTYQEHRNCANHSLCINIRNRGEKPETKEMFQKLFGFSDTSIDARKHDETIAQFLLSIRGENCKKKDLDSMYYQENATIDSKEEKTLNYLLSTLEKFSIDNLTKKYNGGQLFSLVCLLISMRDGAIKIKNHSKLFEIWSTTDDQARIDSKAKYTEDEADKSYHRWTHEYLRKDYQEKMKDFWLEYIDKNFENLKENEIIGMQEKRTNKERPSYALKKILAGLQGNTTRYGEKITEQDLRLANKIHVAHVKSRTNNGKFETSNLELQFAETNLKNGKEDLEPYFEFQKQKL